MKSSSPTTSSRGFASAKPVCFMAGLLLCHSVEALVPNTAMRSISSHQRRSCVRARGAGGLRCSAGEGETERADSSEIYAAVRRRLQELDAARSRGDGRELVGDGDPRSMEGVFNQCRGSAHLHWDDSVSRRMEPLASAPSGADETSDDAGLWAYSSTEMKKAYYQAFWRARNLGNKAKIDMRSGKDDSYARPPLKEEGAPSTMLSPMAMAMITSRSGASDEEAGKEEKAVAASEIEGLTQAYCLVEESVSATEAVACLDPVSAGSFSAKESVEIASRGRAFATSEAVEPQGLSQLLYLDPKTEETAARSIAAPSPSFLREKLGVPGAVVQDLRQVELDHARLAMLAVLLSGAVGAGVPTTADFMDASATLLSGLAHVARTPWLDPCVAGAILALKALSEGDWRLGKGALAGWADQGLRVATDMGAKVLRLGSGDKLRKLAVDMEVRHGRAALGAVVCAMAQQGLITVGA